jgi:hypothetical protein
MMKKRIYYLIFIILLTILGCNPSEQNEVNLINQKQVTISEEFLGKLSLFILIGQSNMSGRGELTETPQEVNPRVFVFGNDYRWHHAVEPIDSPIDQVDAVSIDGDAGYSIATAFAHTMLENDPDLIIGFIPCAAGGSSIQKWQRNLSEQSLYGSCLKRARAASTVGKITGLLFCQGPADARDPKKYPDKKGSPFKWKEKFTRFVEDIRMDLGIRDLPVVFSQMGSSTHPEGWLYWDEVKKQQAEVSLPYTIMTTEEGLPLSEAVHLTKDGYDTLGLRYAEAFLNLTQEGKSQ